MFVRNGQALGSVQHSAVPKPRKESPKSEPKSEPVKGDDSTKDSAKSEPKASVSE